MNVLEVAYAKIDRRGGPAWYVYVITAAGQHYLGPCRRTKDSQVLMMQPATQCGNDHRGYGETAVYIPVNQISMLLIVDELHDGFCCTDALWAEIHALQQVLAVPFTL